MIENHSTPKSEVRSVAMQIEDLSLKTPDLMEAVVFIEQQLKQDTFPTKIPLEMASVENQRALLREQLSQRIYRLSEEGLLIQKECVINLRDIPKDTPEYDEEQALLDHTTRQLRTLKEITNRVATQQ